MKLPSTWGLIALVLASGCTHIQTGDNSGRYWSETPAPLQPAPCGAKRTELAGRSLDGFPYFEFIRTFDPGIPLEIAIDRDRELRETAQNWEHSAVDVYCVSARSSSEWESDPQLVDARSAGPQPILLTMGGLRRMRFKVRDFDELSRQADHRLGVGYDLVIDRDRDGRLGPGDVIDGGAREPGCFLVHDTTRAGPLEVSFLEHAGGPHLGQRIHYPTAIASLDVAPLVVISHGYTHVPEYYDFIGRHLASYGYVVMAHTNDVGRGDARGTESAALTTITNTDHLLGNLGEIGDGVLEGRIDSQRIVWIGHSTGGECVVRAHTRLRRGEITPEHFSLEDIALICSICPVSFLSPDRVAPIGVPYHVFSGGADTDTSGAPLPGYVQSLAIFERATGPRSLTYVQNSGHEWFHGKKGGRPLANGPDLAGRAAVHTVVRGYLLPLVELYTRDNLAAREFFTRSAARFQPVGIDPAVVISNEFDDGAEREGFVIDDFQFSPESNQSSSGGAVRFDVSHLEEISMIDRDGSFAWTGQQPSNGMARGMAGHDDPRCAVFDWTVGDEKFYELRVIQKKNHWSPEAVLSFRACQGTRHPETVALAGPLTFMISLEDLSGQVSRLDLAHYGAVPPPYLRTGYGEGAGWQNEFTTIRIRVADFLADGTPLDLKNIAAVRFEFGGEFGSERGRLGLDDIRLTQIDPPPERDLVIRGPLRLPRFASATQKTPITFEIRHSLHSFQGGELYYRFDGGKFHSTDLDLTKTPHEYTASIPAGGSHAEVEFAGMVYAVDGPGSKLRYFLHPTNAPTALFRLPVGDVVTVWSEDLDEDPRWSTTGEWAFGVPEGLGGGEDRGAPDPTAGATGAHVYGINLAGNYGSSTDPQHLIAGPINLRRSRETTLEFQRWLNCDARRWLRAEVSISTDRKEWTQVWRNGDDNVEDEEWTLCAYDISSIADGQKKVWIRFTLKLEVDDVWSMSGWNIDDLRVTGVK